uniref:LRAT domain-containing protein n=1 Tax=Neogobius melanostomus TaxID=47308 RepID=A0A8C6TC55_9GOBI
EVKMKTTLLAALLFQLLSQTVQYKYGDIIAFKRRGNFYKHFGIYIGGQKFPKQKEGDDIFHYASKDLWRNKCKFGQLRKERNHVEFNYLDNFNGSFEVKVGTPDEITERIQIRLQDCPKYKLLKENCEHLATYIRYNVSLALQVCLGRVETNRCESLHETLFLWWRCRETCGLSGRYPTCNVVNVS